MVHGSTLISRGAVVAVYINTEYGTREYFNISWCRVTVYINTGVWYTGVL